VSSFAELRNGAGELLDAAFTASEGEPLAEGLLVVIGHGVTANKDRAWALALTRALAGAGVDSLRFSFSGNGESEGDFRESTVTKEVADLGAVLERAAPGRRICYVGHSMGGAVGVLRAAADSRVELLVSLAGMVHTADFNTRKFGALTPGQDLMWDKPECPLSEAFVADMNAIGTVLPKAEEIRVPWLLVHGEGDSVVPCSESEELAGLAARAELVRLPGADHLFSGADEARMAEAVVSWLKRVLRSL